MTPPPKGTARRRRAAGRLLLAVDFSTPSRNALDAAAALARDLGVGIVLLHVSPLKETILPKGSKVSRRTPASPPSDAAQLSAEWADALRGAGIAVEPVNEVGDPASVILEQAKRRGCSLVVLASSGKGRLRSLLVGSTTQDLLRRSRLPVLVVPSRRPKRRAEEPARKVILAAVDLSPAGDAAFAAALGLALDLKAQVRLLHVIHLPMPVASFPTADAALSVDFLESQEDDAVAALADLASRARPRKVGVVPSVQVGDPASVILAEARLAGAALIVVASHGQSATRQFFLGSVAQAVVQLADRPVLVVPEAKGPDSGRWVR